MLGHWNGTVARRGLSLIAALALMGCQDGLQLGAAGEADGAPAAASSAATSGPVDVAAPDLFQASEPGLWDGRPSLGGVWVAHPDAVDPERVRIVNRANGQEVIGALFRRERDLPGPALQVSSDAAKALGMLAGAPANLEVTALRRQEAPKPPPAEATAPQEPAATPQDTPPAAAPAAAAPAAAPAPSADPAAVSAVTQAAAAILAGAAQAPAGAIATTTLDAAGSPQPAAGGATPSPLRSPFVQLGVFDREANATEAAQALAAKGLPARVVAGGNGWRLLLGPASTAAEQQALLARAVAEGFDDAYLVRS